MLIFILKFSACLAVLLLFYKVVLERSSMHQFKRFYLLAVVAISITIPLTSIIEYVEPTIISDFESIETAPILIDMETDVIEENSNIVPILLWCIYSLGVLIFLLKFARNFNRIILRIKQHTKFKIDGFINVLLLQPVAPHTFFKYLFFNKHKFENAEIPKEVILHEQTHAKQLHSIDVFLIEVLQIIFWFNPLIYLLKRDIKLNHEFLADFEVLKSGIQPSNYQNLLLTFSAHHHEPQLANAINYSSIKKRFTVMKTQSSKASIWIRSLLILPILAILFYSFTERVEIEKDVQNASIENDIPESSVNPPENIENDFSNEEIELYINEKGELLYKNKVIKVEDLSSIYTLENHMNISIITTLDVEKEITSSVTKQIQNFLRDQGLKKFSVCISAENQDNLATQKEVAAYNAWAKKIHNKTTTVSNSAKSLPIVVEQNLIKFSQIYKRMSPQQKKQSVEFPFLDFDVKTKAQQKATEKQIAEYNSWAKQITTAMKKAKATNNISLYPIVKKKHIDRYRHIYNNLMSEQQRENAEPWPNFPPPPPPPPAPELLKTGFIEINNQLLYYVEIGKRTKYYNNKGFQVSKEGKTISKSRVNASDVIPGQYITKVYAGNKVFTEFNDNIPSRKDGASDSPPPPPPAPKSTLDFAIELAKKNATFYFEKKEISSDEAIAMLKKNPELNLLAKHTKTKQPLVYISEAPITLDKKKKRD